LCSVLNFITMMLDCLDGMHARTSNQCSKMGELLDHWFDAMHVPMIAAGIAMAARLDPWFLASTVILNAVLYNSQLIIYNTTHKFINIAGVEAQIGTSALYLVAVVLSVLSVPYSSFIAWARLGFGIAAVIVTSQIVWQFRPHFVQPAMWTSAGAFLLMNVLLAISYLSGHMSIIPYTLTAFFCSFRITGTYVLYSIQRRPYSGVDIYVILWGLAGIYVQYGHVSQIIHLMFPYLFCLHCAKSNISELRPHLDMLLSPNPKS